MHSPPPTSAHRPNKICIPTYRRRTPQR